jgi:hypothetical protein
MAQDTDACIAANERAVSDHKVGKLLDERTQLAQCSALTCPAPVRSSCAQRLADVTRALPSIVFAAKDAAGHDLEHVTVSIDGGARPRALDGKGIVLDPGDHDFVFQAPDLPPVARHFVMHEDEQNRMEAIVLGTPPAAAAGPAPAEQPPDPERTSSDGSAMRGVGLVVGGVGIAGLAVGGIFAGLSVSAHDSYQNACGSAIGAAPNQCNQAGVNGERDAATKGTVSTVALIGGGALLATGATLFLLAPRARTQVGVGLGRLVLQGSF